MAQVISTQIRPLVGVIPPTAIIPAGKFTSVHKALDILEILGYVYDELGLENKKGSVAAMAQACRAFTEPALDVIWRTLVGLVSLSSIMPVETEDGKAVGFFEDNGIDPWQRFDTFAYRVREVTLLGDIKDINVLRMLVHHKKAKGRPIFPNLHTLNGGHTPPVLVQPMVAHTLRFLQINDHSTAVLVQRMVPLLQGFADEGSKKLDHQADNVRRILGILPILTAANRDGAKTNQSDAQSQRLRLWAIVPSSHLDKVLSLRQLRHLVLFGLTPEGVKGDDYLRSLSMLPSIYEVCITLHENEFFRPVPDDGFLSLERLTVQGRAPNVQSFLSALPSDRLRYLMIHDSEENWSTSISGPAQVRARLQQWRACFGVIVEQTKVNHKLETLRITLYSTTANPADARGCGADLRMISIIRPLLKVWELKELELLGFIKMPLSDAEFREIAGSWWRIREMTLPPPLGEVEQPSFVALILVSSLCESMVKLSMGLDPAKGLSMNHCEEMLRYTMPSLFGPELAELDVGESDLRMNDAGWIAHVLGGFFPNLKKVTATSRQSKVAAAQITKLLRENPPAFRGVETMM